MEARAPAEAEAKEVTKVAAFTETGQGKAQDLSATIFTIKQELGA